MAKISVARVRQRLDVLGISDKEAGRRVTGSPSFVKNILNGRSKNPGWDNVLGLARALHCSPQFLYGQSDEIGSPPDVESRETSSLRLAEGLVEITYPENISPESYQDLEDWLTIVLRQIKRKARP